MAFSFGERTGRHTLAWQSKRDVVATTEVMAVAVEGALGALSRFATVTCIHHHWASPFPVATFLVNVVGSLALGFVLTDFPTKSTGSVWLALIATGFLGSFTTFSTFSWETVAMIRSGSVHLAMCYAVQNWVIALISVFARVWNGANVYPA